MAVILTQSVTAVWTVLMILQSAPLLTLISLKWTPAMMDLVQVGTSPLFLNRVIAPAPHLRFSLDISIQKSTDLI